MVSKPRNFFSREEYQNEKETQTCHNVVTGSQASEETVDRWQTTGLSRDITALKGWQRQAYIRTYTWMNRSNPDSAPTAHPLILLFLQAGNYVPCEWVNKYITQIKTGMHHRNVQSRKYRIRCKPTTWLPCPPIAAWTCLQDWNTSIDSWHTNCARMTRIPVCRISVDLPPIFGPVMSKHELWPSATVSSSLSSATPITVSFEMNSSPVKVCAMQGWRASRISSIWWPSVEISTCGRHIVPSPWRLREQRSQIVQKQRHEEYLHWRRFLREAIMHKFSQGYPSMHNSVHAWRLLQVFSIWPLLLAEAAFRTQHKSSLIENEGLK